MNALGSNLNSIHAFLREGMFGYADKRHILVNAARSVKAGELAEQAGELARASGF